MTMRPLSVLTTAALLPLWAASCDAGHAMHPRPAHAVPAATATAIASAAAVGRVAADRATVATHAPGVALGDVVTPLTPALPRGLELTVFPVQGKRWALLSGRDGDSYYVKRLGLDGPLAGQRALGRRRPVMGLDGDHPWLISSDGDNICVEALDVEGPPSCKRFRPLGAVLLGGRVVFVEQKPDAPASANAKHRRRAASKRRRRRKQSRGGRKKHRNLHPATDPKPLTMRVWLTRLDARGRFAEKGAPDARPIDSEFTFERPLPGMGVVDVAATAKGAWLLYFEHRKAKKEKRKTIPQARLRVARLSNAGKLVTASETTMYQGPRHYGYIEGHHRPQLFAHRSGVLMVGRYHHNEGGRTRIGFEAIGVKPGGVRHVSNIMMGLDPWRRAGGPTMTRAEYAALTQFAKVGPVRSVGQPDSDAGRVAWVGDRAYYLCDEGLCAHTLTAGVTRRYPRPFAAAQSGLAWGAITAAGEGLALSGEALLVLHADGTLLRRAGDFDAADRAPGRPVKIADSWWRLQPAADPPGGLRVVRVWPAGPDKTTATALNKLAVAGTSVLVGGEATGLFLSVAGGVLSSWRLRADGRSEPVATVAAPLVLGVEAVRRLGGGALLVGRDRGGHAVSFALHADGGRGAVYQLGGALGQPLLQPLPAGGALLHRSPAAAVVWLDNEGKPLAQWSPPGPASDDGACPGWRLDGAVAGAVAGAVLRAPGARGCALAPPQPTTDGYRWWGWRQGGLKRTAVVVVAKAGAAHPNARVKQMNALQQIPAAAAGEVRRRPCPPDMVWVAGAYCIDRFEAQLVHPDTALPLSPYYPSEAGIVAIVLRAWAGGRFYEGDLHAHAMALPPLLRPAREELKAPRAQNRYGVVPSGFVSGYAAERVCAAAGKRLCSPDEWKKACRGEEDRKFPYGDKYQQGVCNVHSYYHPATTLHGNAAIGHLDPRLNLVTHGGKTLLRKTGATPACASHWGDDAIYDMVGNLDEWLDDNKGSFSGGFYARSTKNGCSSKIKGHPRRYLDYSLGVRCCLAARPQ